ncbi:AarF/ABC1/UbiB kinase family protein [Synechocystis salina LEGE 00031]|uniref:AarF/ABC1/UbiB kinase family protein n=1 Tax=Synechocystis salina LEGE 00031 TaxID=1828736 RepID=A0ABR9VP10_9SYNC|nr:AarF/ABC1/UbiB kinase family protein [Synechocystis salina]MBE9241412.1 AarF/ABC1/UbiB kinase family protein [Synechocystis salina LEGE 00041]MBE9253077.1 AarF/ABC1/UbiB kinase family protein [Synechocystis salina LEGE 00031]
MFALPQAGDRRGEIIKVLLSNGWDYMNGLLTMGKVGEPQIPTPEVLTKILVELGPFYVKLGQLLSTRPDLLPPRYINALTALQSNVPPLPWSAIDDLLQREFPQPLGETFQEIEPEPIAAGSIGQIHRAVLQSGETVAIKVKRPGIDAVVEQDSLLIKDVAELISRTEFGQNYDIVKLADEFTQTVKAELNFDTEAIYTNTLRSNLAKTTWFDPNQLVIPKVYWKLTNEKFLVLEWLDGVPILTADLSQPPSEKNITERKKEITTLLFRAFFQQLYVDGFFHADPHPGNIFYLEDGRLALIDCGMVGRLDPRTRQLLTEMLLAIVDLDAKRCAQLTVELSESVGHVNFQRLEVDYERMLRKYYDLSLSEFNFSEVVYEFLRIARVNKLKVPACLGLYAKCLANLEGAGRQFNPELNLFTEINPLITDLFRRQLFGTNPLQTALRTVLDLKAVSLKTPRQMDVLLDRLTTETLQWNVRIEGLEPLRRTIDKSANRLSFSIVLGSLIMGAAILSTGNDQQLTLIANVLFVAATVIGFWLVISILRSGRLK